MKTTMQILAAMALIAVGCSTTNTPRPRIYPPSSGSYMHFERMKCYEREIAQAEADLVLVRQRESEVTSMLDQPGLTPEYRARLNAYSEKLQALDIQLTLDIMGRHLDGFSHAVRAIDR